MAEITYADALNQALREEMQKHPEMIIMGEDVATFGGRGGVFGVTADLMKEFGAERVRNTPISEAGFLGAGLGCALAGVRTVVEIMYIDFTTCCMDQIVNQAAKIKYMTGGQARVPLVIRTCQGAGRNAAAQHSQCLEVLFAHIPGIKVVIPADPYDAKGLLKTAINDDNPIMFIEAKGLYRMTGEVPEEEYFVPFGQAAVKREGSDVTVVAISSMVPPVLQAAEQLEKEDGISVEVIDPRTLTPLNLDPAYESVQKTNRAVVVQEAALDYGAGAEIAARIQEECFDYLDAPVKRLGAYNVPIPFSKNMEDFVIPNPTWIVEAVKGVLYRT